jgi:hypothetical protein
MSDEPPNTPRLLSSWRRVISGVYIWALRRGSTRDTANLQRYDA